MRKLIWLLFMATFCLSTAAVDATYYQTKALPGDGIYSILRRYELDSHSCNFSKFYQLNDLKRNARLVVGKQYRLPIKEYRYNGRNIRSTIGNDDWDTAVRIRDYNLSLTERGVVEGTYDKSKLLLVPYHILNCLDEEVDIPSPVSEEPERQDQLTANVGNNNASASSTGGQRIFPIFGEKYAYTPLASTKLRGKVFYVVGGHGGPDPGAIGQRGSYRLCEDEYAYDVALRLCRNLIAHGATAYMVNRDPNDGIRSERFLACDQDEVVWGGIRQSPSQKVRLTQRSDVINDLHEKHRLQGVTDQTVVVVHVDSRSKSQETDLFFYHHPSSEAGLALARKMHRTMRQKYRQYRASGEYHGTVTARDLHMLRECEPTGVYIELANIRNAHDQQRIIIERNRELLAEWMLEGLMQK